MWLLALLCCVAVSHAATEDEWRTVKIAQGPLRGRRESDGVYAFYNIPYATAPTGQDKFKAPLPPPQWTEPFEAVDKGVICHQADLSFLIPTHTKTMQEECLIANVYVPDTEETNLSVVIFIHGGAFQVGYGDFLKAKQLMATKKIIVVNINYRLGIHGFLCLGTKDAPGNAGMKDIVAGLRWVKKNIASFGGNPDDVTVSGYSAGAAVADLLILSKSAKGLFHKVILESGSSLAAFAVQSDPLEVAKSHARSLNFTNVDDIDALEDFYKNIPYHILKADGFATRTDHTFQFVPCVERDIGQEMFLDDSPRNILMRGDYAKVPMLNGFTSMEGLLRAPFFDHWKLAMNEKFSDYLSPDLQFNNNEERERIAQLIKEFYFGNKTVDTDSILCYIDFFTDTMFAIPALRSISMNVARGNDQIYLYHYSFVDENDPYVPHTEVRGANHCAQTLAIYDDLAPKNTTVEFTNIRKIMRDMWLNFITTGEPVPEGSSLPLKWPPTSDKNCPYMSLGSVVELGDVLLEYPMRFWEEIFAKYYRDPIPPTLPTKMIT